MSVCIHVCMYVFIYSRMPANASRSAQQFAGGLWQSSSSSHHRVCKWETHFSSNHNDPMWRNRRPQSPTDIGDYILTPPTFSKNPPWLPKWMSCSLKNHVNLSSSDGSWLTWHGRTMLSPTVTSSVDGGVVIMVGSETNNYTPESAKNQSNW